MAYSDIIKNEHFNNLAAIIRVQFHGSTAPGFWAKEKAFQRVTPTAVGWNAADVIATFTELLTFCSKASQMSYTEQDLDWFVETLDCQDKTTIKLFQAWYSAPDIMMTCQEVAEATGTAASNWRNKAASGEVPGAVKKGKTWLLPRSVMRSQGLDV